VLRGKQFYSEASDTGSLRYSFPCFVVRSQAALGNMGYLGSKAKQSWQRVAFGKGQECNVV
jgi:hypothetical protein